MRLVATDDSEITTKVIKATNRQTEVKPEAFISLSGFHKELEDYYESISRELPHKLHYERRSRQYAGSSLIRPSQVVTLAAQVASFTAVFLEEPHSCHRYYGELIDAYKGRIFLATHRCATYFASSYIVHRVDGVFLGNRIARRLRPLRYHVGMLVRTMVGGKLPSSLENKASEEYARGIIDTLSDNARSAQVIGRAAELVSEELLRTEMMSREAARTKSFTQGLLRRLV